MLARSRNHLQLQASWDAAVWDWGSRNHFRLQATWDTAVWDGDPGITFACGLPAVWDGDLGITFSCRLPGMLQSVMGTHYSRSTCHYRAIASLELMLGEETMTMGFLLSLMSTQAALGQLDGGPLPSLGTGNSHSARLRLAKYVGRPQGV